MASLRILSEPERNKESSESTAPPQSSSVWLQYHLGESNQYGHMTRQKQKNNEDHTLVDTLKMNRGLSSNVRGSANLPKPAFHKSYSALDLRPGTFALGKKSTPRARRHTNDGATSDRMWMTSLSIDNNNQNKKDSNAFLRPTTTPSRPKHRELLPVSGISGSGLPTISQSSSQATSKSALRSVRTASSSSASSSSKKRPLGKTKQDYLSFRPKTSYSLLESPAVDSDISGNYMFIKVNHNPELLNVRTHYTHVHTRINLKDPLGLHSKHALKRNRTASGFISFNGSSSSSQHPIGGRSLSLVENGCELESITSLDGSDMGGGSSVNSSREASVSTAIVSPSSIVSPLPSILCSAKYIDRRDRIGGRDRDDRHRDSVHRDVLSVENQPAEFDLNSNLTDDLKLSTTQLNGHVTGTAHNQDVERSRDLPRDPQRVDSRDSRSLANGTCDEERWSTSNAAQSQHINHAHPAPITTTTTADSHSMVINPRPMIAANPLQTTSNPTNGYMSSVLADHITDSSHEDYGSAAADKTTHVVASHLDKGGLSALPHAVAASQPPLLNDDGKHQFHEQQQQQQGQQQQQQHERQNPKHHGTDDKKPSQKGKHLSKSDYFCVSVEVPTAEIVDEDEALNNIDTPPQLQASSSTSPPHSPPSTTTTTPSSTTETSAASANLDEAPNHDDSVEESDHDVAPILKVIVSENLIEPPHQQGTDNWENTSIGSQGSVSKLSPSSQGSSSSQKPPKRGVRFTDENMVHEYEPWAPIDHSFDQKSPEPSTIEGKDVVDGGCSENIGKNVNEKEERSIVVKLPSTDEEREGGGDNIEEEESEGLEREKREEEDSTIETEHTEDNHENLQDNHAKQEDKCKVKKEKVKDREEKPKNRERNFDENEQNLDKKEQNLGEKEPNLGEKEQNLNEKEQKLKENEDKVEDVASKSSSGGVKSKGQNVDPDTFEREKDISADNDRGMRDTERVQVAESHNDTDTKKESSKKETTIDGDNK